MFWIFMMVTGFSLTLVALGAFTTLVSVLSWGLKIALLVIVGLSVLLLWRKIF